MTPTIELFNARRFIIHIHAFNITLHLPHEQLLDRALRLRPLLNPKQYEHMRPQMPHKIPNLHLHLQLILQHTVELLNIVL